MKTFFDSSNRVNFLRVISDERVQVQLLIVIQEVTQAIIRCTAEVLESQFYAVYKIIQVWYFM